MSIRFRSGFCSHSDCKGKQECLIANTGLMLCFYHNKQRIQNAARAKMYPDGKLKKKNYLHHKRNIVKKIRVKKTLRKQPQTERQKLVKQLDKIVSIYVRRLYPKCFTCGEPTTDCAHYMSRRNMGTRFLEDNLRGGCVECNRYNHGELPAFRLALIADIGIARVEAVEYLAHSEIKMSNNDLEIILEIYESKLNLL